MSVARDWSNGRALRDAGWTLDAIGQVYGVSRERARQKLGKGPRAPYKTAVDPLKILAVVRDPSVMGWEDVSARLGYSVTSNASSPCAVIAALGMVPAVVRLFRWRRMATTRRKYAAILRALYADLGRSPVCAEIGVALGIQKNAVGSLILAVFGSIPKAMAYADIPYVDGRKTRYVRSREPRRPSRRRDAIGGRVTP